MCCIPRNRHFRGTCTHACRTNWNLGWHTSLHRCTWLWCTSCHCERKVGRNARKKREEETRGETRRECGEKRGENVKRNAERNTERNVTDSGETTVEKRGRQWRNVRSCIALCTGKVQRGLTCPKRRCPHRCGCQTGNRYLSG